MATNGQVFVKESKYMIDNLEIVPISIHIHIKEIFQLYTFSYL